MLVVVKKNNVLIEGGKSEKLVIRQIENAVLVSTLKIKKYKNQIKK